LDSVESSSQSTSPPRLLFCSSVFGTGCKKAVQVATATREKASVTVVCAAVIVASQSWRPPPFILPPPRLLSFSSSSRSPLSAGLVDWLSSHFLPPTALHRALTQLAFRRLDGGRGPAASFHRARWLSQSPICCGPGLWNLGSVRTGESRSGFCSLLLPAPTTTLFPSHLTLFSVSDLRRRRTRPLFRQRPRFSLPLFSIAAVFERVTPRRPAFSSR